MTSAGRALWWLGMKKMKWILISMTGILALAGGGGWLALRSWIEKNATPDAVVQRLEEQWNCRATVDRIDVSLFSNPARIVVAKLGIGLRDSEVGKPLAQRAPSTAGPGVLMVQNAVLEVDTNALAAGRLHIKKLALTDVWMREEITPEGTSVMQEIFRKPAPVASASLTPPPAITIDGKPIVATTTQATPAAKPAPLSTPDSPPAPTPAVAAAPAPKSDLPFGIVVDEAVLQQATFRIRNRQARTTTNMNNLSVRISAVDVDTSNLAQHNQCKIELDGQIDSSGRAKSGDQTVDVKFADFTLAARGTIKPFDETTLKFSPHGQVTLDLKKGGVFGGTQTIGQVAAKDKDFAKVKENFGIDVSDLVIGGPLQEDVTVGVNYGQGRIFFDNEARFAFPEYLITLRKESWINPAADDHNMRLQLLPNDAVSKKILDGVTVKMGAGLAKLAVSVFNDGQGKLAFEVVSSDRLSKPKFRLDGTVGALEQMIKGLFK